MVMMMMMMMMMMGLYLFFFFFCGISSVEMVGGGLSGFVDGLGCTHSNIRICIRLSQ